MARDFYASPFGALYSAYMERPRIARLVSRIVWGGDLRPYYELMRAVGELPPGATVVDCPCGAGPALRALPGGDSIRYVGVDLSSSMLRRARARTEARQLGEVELIEASATAIPLPDGTADLFLSFWGLHCFEQPAAALCEAARVLAPGGRLVLSSFLRGDDSLRQRLLVRPGTGDFGAVGGEFEVRAWLGDAGFEIDAWERAGPMLYVDARCV